MRRREGAANRNGGHRDGVLAEVKRHRSHDLFIDPLTAMDVYFIRAEGLGVKIGKSRDATRRLAELQSGSPVKLTLMGSFEGDHATEQALHHRFRRYRMHGEWFSEEIVPLLELILERPQILSAA